MDRHKPNHESIDDFLRKAHAARPELELSAQWQAKLMGEIAELSRRSPRMLQLEEPIRAFTRLMFRFAMAGAFVAAGLLLYAHLYGPDLNRQAAGVILEQPVSPVLLEKLIWS
ncbi:hypothetical protein AAU61_00085 [Desulfocarbo indianensis]|nr:hypothetical protein AAU61_00085 [Desulfocarbo indianensis]